jgi:hypothetical protein
LPLNDRYQEFLETTITPADFEPSYIPSLQEKENLCEDRVYLSKEPAAWSEFPKDWSDEIVKGFAHMTDNQSITFEDILFRWAAVHANFINPKYRTDATYSNAPYSIEDSKYISTCCVELFNLLASDEEAFLVRPCIGAVIAEVLADNKYYRVDIMKNKI